MSNSQEHIALVGLGSMGTGMARSLLRAGLDVVGYDINRNARQAFADNDGQVADNISEAASGADCVISVVVNAAQTESVIAEALPAMAADGVFVSCATIPTTDALAMATIVEASGRHYLDAPISGGSIKANTGEITVMASGSEAAFAKAQPALSAMAANVFRLGDEAGAGSSMKTINQLLCGVQIAAACEALALAIKLGLDPETVYKVITKAAGNSWVFENRVPHILAGDYEPRSAIDIFVKDMGIVIGTGNDEKFPTPMASAAQQLYLMTSAAGMGGDDDSSVVRLYAQLTGLELPETKNSLA